MTNGLIKKFLWILFIICAVGIGLYPALYVLFGNKMGLLATKSAEILASHSWQLAFYTHIGFGGFSLILGFSQFSQRLRISTPVLHQNAGKGYIIAVLLSGLASLYLAFYATGGIISSLGFGSLGALWLVTTFIAYEYVKKGKYKKHRKWMIRSYALAFAAVSLRFILPFSLIILKMDFLDAYRIVAWMCWVPNLIFAEWYVRTFKGKILQSA